MTEAWALKYRPRKFSQIVGQKPVKAVLNAMVRTDKVPSGLLFSGSYGSGKTSTARILAAALNCLQDDRPCGECESCVAVFDGTSLDVTEIDAASNGGVAEIRRLTEFLSYATTGRCRVVLLDEVQSMSRPAYDALLKTLEEPIPNTVFILLTTEPGRIAKTILSRLMPFEFTRIPVPLIEAQLRRIAAAEAVDVTDELLALIAHSAQGSLRDAVMRLDQSVRAGIFTGEHYSALYGEYDFAPELLRRMALSDFPGVFAMLENEIARIGDPAYVSSHLIDCLAEMLSLANGGEIDRVGSQLLVRQQLLPLLSTDRIMKAMEVLWDLKTRTSLSDNTTAALTLSCVMIMRAVGERRQAPTPPPNVTAAQEAPGKLSLNEMRARGIE